MSMKFLLRLCLAWSASLPLLAAEHIDVWSYHLSPPFHTADGQGLSAAFVELLNRHPLNAGRFAFALRELPRKRLDLQLRRGQPGVVLWASPRFFAEADAPQRWSRPLLLDRQDVISLRERPVEYRAPASLAGLRLGGVLGHRYLDLEGEIAAGRIRREDVQGDLQNLHKLLAGRLDIALMPRSAWLYYSRQGVAAQTLHASAQPLYFIERRLLCSAALSAEACDWLQQRAAELPGEASWHELLDRHGLKPIGVQH
ncbi:PAAT family amino acid ABC transporter substrate-binding protein [Pseudomonas oligotrophica]|uniref:PAAT family amino acid ABC transporter substrate-binding protein n=1 Tax=Pseudomonas oligotrophica TaxID=2912055 RepID=UPI0032B7ED1E